MWVWKNMCITRSNSHESRLARIIESSQQVLYTLNQILQLNIKIVMTFQHYILVFHMILSNKLLKA